MSKISVELQNVSKQFGDFLAVDDVSLQIGEGQFFSLLGPSGCGKTTTLRMIAGFELPTAGEIYLRGKPVGHLPPFKRNVNTIFQDYALFPHMTVAQNVAFGLEMEKMSKSEIQKRVDEVLEMVHLPQMAQRRPAQLSGGQQQRVALARAIVKRPDVLLLDEPLSALDLKLRQAMRFELKELQRRLGITFIFVTHDQEEALFMSDVIAVMDSGKVAQIGSPPEIYHRPVNRYVADFIGEINFLDCKVTRLDGEMATVLVGDKIEIQAMRAPETVVGEKGSVIIRPEKITIHANEVRATDQRNVVSAVIVEKAWIGTDTHFTARLQDGSKIRIRHQNMAVDDSITRLDVNDTVYLSWQKKAGQMLSS